MTSSYTLITGLLVVIWGLKFVPKGEYQRWVIRIYTWSLSLVTFDGFWLIAVFVVSPGFLSWLSFYIHNNILQKHISLDKLKPQRQALKGRRDMNVRTNYCLFLLLIEVQINSALASAVLLVLLLLDIIWLDYFICYLGAWPWLCILSNQISLKNIAIRKLLSTKIHFVCARLFVCLFVLLSIRSSV